MHNKFIKSVSAKFNQVDSAEYNKKQLGIQRCFLQCFSEESYETQSWKE